MPDTTLNINLQDEISKNQRGEITGSRMWEGKGERAGAGVTAQGEDIWRGNELAISGSTSIPIPDDAGVLFSITCENGNDTAGGSGVEKVEIHYLDPTGLEKTHIESTNGGTVDIPIKLGRFFNGLHALSANGGEAVAVGHIILHKTGDNTATGIYNMIAAGGNESLVINKMVPLGKRLLMKGWRSTEARGKRITARIRSTDNEGILNAKTFLFKDTAYLNKMASGERPLYTVHPELSIIKVSSWNDQPDSECSASFWGILENKT